MDIVTHAMMGAIAASPFLQSHPEAAVAFVFGSVAPDLDAFSRVFGRRAFLSAHQTWSHSLPVIAVIGLVGWVLREGCGVYAPWAPLAFALPLSAGIFLSNEIHAAAHAKARSLPGPVRALQRMGLIQSPLHHAAHHRHLKNVNFCTLTDWVNPALERVRFWRRLEALMRYTAGVRIRRDPVVRRQQRRRWKAA